MIATTTAFAAVLLLALSTGTSAGQGRSPALPPPLEVVPEILDVPVQPLRLVPNQSSTSAQEPDDEFKPLSELPPDEQLPAAPMVVAAYIFVLLAFFVYVFSLSRRLAAVKQDMSRLEGEVKRSSRT